MLNTESCAAKSLIWVAILAICTTSAWSFWSLPTPAALIAGLLGSELAAFASRNQIATTGIIGLGGAALAYVLNGWRDRQERRHTVERAEKRDGAVLAREARDIAAACEAAVPALIDRSAPMHQITTGLMEALAPNDHLLLAASAADLAQLGPGAGAAARAVRASVRRLMDAVGDAQSDEALRGRNLTAYVAETAAAARSAARIFDALATAGPAAADRLRLLSASASVTQSGTADTANVHRLHPPH